MRRTLTGAAGILGILLLAGCSTSQAEPVPESAPEVANESACESFAALTREIPDRLGSDQIADEMWEELRVDFDEIALTADGAVQDRMLALVDDWPDLVDVMLGGDQLDTPIDAIGRACEADGIPTDYETLS